MTETEIEVTKDQEENALEPSETVQELRDRLRKLPGDWYVLHVHAGYEKQVKHNILHQRDVAIKEGAPGGEDILEVEVPIEEIRQIKNGVNKLVKRVRIPGYVLVRMFVNEDSWAMVRHTPAVANFVGNSNNPVALKLDEVVEMLTSTHEIEKRELEEKTTGSSKAKIKTKNIVVDYEIGETIQIVDGSFAGFPGTISEIKPETGKLIALVSLFERDTPVELEFSQVEKI